MGVLRTSDEEVATAWLEINFFDDASISAKPTDCIGLH